LKLRIKLLRIFLRFHYRVVLRFARSWQSRWGDRSFLVTLSVGIGLLAAVAAAGLHKLVVSFEEFGIWLTKPHTSYEYFWLLLLLLLPMAGLTASFLVQRFFGGPRYAKSLSPLILQLSRKRTNIPVIEIFNHMISSALSVGFGGSAGLEAPSVLTGAAIGANSASFFKVNRAPRTLLVGCGTAAAISAIFDSPITGVLFAAEVMLPEFSVSMLVPMLMSSAVAAVVSRMIAGSNRFFFAITEPWETNAIPCYLAVGMICAVVGVYVIRCAYFLAEKLKTRFRSPWQRLFAGGTMLCLLLFLFPILRGQGYLYIEKLFKGELGEIVTNSPLLSMIPSESVILVIVIMAVLLLKVVASVLTVDSGGDGGIFAPAMFIGAFTGFGFARLVNLTGIFQLQECNFVAVGMCGVFTAVMRAPLTGIFLIAEITGGYILLVPLMIVSAISFALARFFEPNSIYRKALVENNLLDDDRDRTMLRTMPVRLSLSRNYHVLKVDQPLERLINLVESTPEEIFPVLDGEGKLLGVVHLEKILSVMLNPKVYGLLLVIDLMEQPVGVVSPDDDLSKAMANFEKYNLKYLPVCDEKGIFHGFIAKAPIFARYRQMVRETDLF